MRIGDELELPKPSLPSPEDARIADLKRAADKGDTGATARQFETLFGVMLVRELRRVMPDGLFGSGPGADVYEGWFDEHLGQALGAHDALGIAGMVKSALTRAQAARDAQAASGAPATRVEAQP